MPTEIPTPAKGDGLFSGFKYIFKAFRLSLWGMFLTFLGHALVPLIYKIMAAMGIGFVAYELGSFALDALFLKVQEYLTQLPSEALVFASMCKIDEALSVVFAGLAVRVSLMGFTSLTSGGKAKQMIWQA